jgi:glucose-1-phosphate adenylyltransferase
MRSYYDAHMDVVSPLPVFNLYNTQWPIYTQYGPQPPVKLAKGADGALPVAEEALLSPGVVVSGGEVRRSVLSPAVRVEQGAVVEDSVLMDGVHVGAGAVVRHAILDKSVRVPPGAELGVDADLDAKRGFMVEDGLTVLGKGQAFPDL